MPLARPEDYRAMLDEAEQGGYALAAINVTSSQTVNAALQGFVDAGADGILQMTTSAGEYASGSVARDMAVGARGLAEFAAAVSERVPVCVALHTDHCTADKLDGFVRPLLAESTSRRARGAKPLFHSHMFDGSNLPLEENLRIASELLDQCAAADVVLELEIGAVGGEEEGAPGADRAHLYSTPADAIAVVEALGSGERGRYLLSATFGNVHGHYAPGDVTLQPQLLGEIQEAVAARLGGRRLQLVFHGGSGSTPAEMATAIGHGVVKVNVDTDAQYAFTRAVAGHMFENYDGVLKVEGGVGRKQVYDPRVWGRAGEAGMAALVEASCRALGSAGRSLAA
jgi:fructose-bisphosphate aldolase, class II